LNKRERKKFIPLLREFQNDRCKCGKPWTTVDHIHPLAAGGLTELNNLQLLCDECHDAKTREDLKTIIAYKRSLKAVNDGISYHKRLYRYSIKWEPHTLGEMTIYPSIYLKAVRFALHVTGVTLQSLPKRHSVLDRKFARIWLNNRPIKNWNEKTIRFRKRVNKPLNVKVMWGSMSDRALLNPPYIKDAEMCVWLYENKLTDQNFQKENVM